MEAFNDTSRRKSLSRQEAGMSFIQPSLSEVLNRRSEKCVAVKASRNSWKGE